VAPPTGVGFMVRDAQSLRDELYSVIQHYSELSRLAQQGEVDPIGQIGKIVKKTAPYLLLVIRDLVPRLGRKEITYYEALYSIIRIAQQFPDVQVLMDSRNEIQQIEQGTRIFTYAVKWLDSSANVRPAAAEIEVVKKKLRDLNVKYRQRYSVAAEDTSTLIPYIATGGDKAPEETSPERMADLVRRAVLELHHLMIEFEPQRRYYFFTNTSRKEVEEDLMNLAWFLFRCGYTVDRVATGYYKEALADFLNRKLLDYLLVNPNELDTIQGVSSHLWIISVMDFASFFELQKDYVDFDDPREAAQQSKFLKSKNRRGSDLIKRILDLQKVWTQKPQGRLVENFLFYRYYSAFGAYHGDHRIQDPRGAQGVSLYMDRLDPIKMEKQAEVDLQQSGRFFSSKTREEMASLIKLIMDSLADPGKVRGKKVKVLGDISSGAMGKVSIGILKNQIVALKRVRAQATQTLGDPVTLLEYEAALNARIQSPDQHPYIVEYYGLVEQDDEKLLINAYHPNDNLTQLVERNWAEKYKPPFSTESKLTLATLEVLTNQLMDCLRRLREKGVVHRDLKTDNILYMVDENERLNRIKVIDFGVALALGPGAVDDIFKGKVVGTFSYMAPEQAKGKSVFQSDLYSVGAIFTVLLTGKLPMIFPKTKTRAELVKQIMRIEQEARPRLTDLNPFLKKNSTLEYLAATVERMLELDPNRRPNVDEVQSAFDGFFSDVAKEKHSLSIFYHRG